MSSWASVGPKAASVVLLVVVCNSARDVPRPRGTANFVQVLDLESLPNGVSTVTGSCPNRPQPTGSETVPDTAFKIANGPLSVPTRQLFPSGFPNTFAILATLKPDSADAGNLFTIYSGFGKALLTFRTSPNVELQYLKANGETGKITFNDSNIKDGNWHRLAFSVVSVGEDGIALILDCDRPYELKERATDFPVRIDTDGVIILGDFVSSFKGILQELLVVPDPTKANISIARPL